MTEAETERRFLAAQATFVYPRSAKISVFQPNPAIWTILEESLRTMCLAVFQSRNIAMPSLLEK